MSDTQKAPDVRALEDRYQILGELRGAAGPQTYIGKRKADGADVFIRLVRSTKDDNNALAHFASDAQILNGLDHANVLRVLDSRWLGADTIAVVNERVRGRTLGELLSTGDLPSHQHAAVILDDVRAALDWARDHGIVHRGVTPETLFFNDGDDRPLVLLSPTSIPMESVPDACEDARTIGTLSWAMLTGERFDGSDADALAERRPNLARRVVDDTAAMTACRNGGRVPDVANYLGVIANADALRQGEIEVARMQAELEEERRKEREAFEAEQRACEARVRETEEQLAAEREDFARRMKEEEARLADAHQQLDIERAQLEQERAEFDERSADLDRARAEVEAIRAEHEQRVAEAVAAAVAATKAEMRAQIPKKPSKFAIWGGGGDKAVDRPAAVLGDSTDREVMRDADQKTLNDAEVAGDAGDDIPSKSARRPDDVSLVPMALPSDAARAPRIATPVGAAPRVADQSGRTAIASSASRTTVVRSAPRKPWVLPTAIVGALALIIAIVIGINHHDQGSTPSTVRIGSTSVVPTAPTQQPIITPRGSFFTQSAGGTLAPRSMSPVLPTANAPAGVPAPSTQPAASASMVDTTQPDSINAPKPKPSISAEERRHEREAAEAARQSQRPRTAPRDSLFSLPTPVSRDTFVRRDTIMRGARSDTVVHYGVPRPLHDTTVRRDTIVKPDTGVRPRPDTLARR